MKKILFTFLFLLICNPVFACTRYWVGTGSTANWNATANTNWSTSSGGSNNASVPTTTDDVCFDANSPAGTISASTAINSIDMTGFTHTLTWNSSVALTIDGNGVTAKLAGTVSFTGSTGTIIFTGTSGTTLFTSGGNTPGGITVNGAGGTVQLQDNLSLNVSAGSITLTTGTLDTNGKTVTAGTLSSSNSNTRALTLGATDFKLNNAGTGTPWNIATSTNMTLTPGSSTIEFTGTVGTKTFAGGGLTYNNIKLNDTNANNLTITGANTFNDITITGGSNAHTLTLPSSTTTTATTFHATGASGHVITLAPGTASTVYTLSVASGTVSCDWLSMTFSTATGGATFYAGANSTDGGNNTGWIFTAPPGGVNSNFFIFMK